MGIDYRDLGYGEIGLTVPTPEEPKRATNADRIRSMSDEELAEWVWSAESAGKAYGVRGKKAWLDWLKREAT